jgi:hypothetical protein
MRIAFYNPIIEIIAALADSIFGQDANDAVCRDLDAADLKSGGFCAAHRSFHVLLPEETATTNAHFWGHLTNSCLLILEPSFQSKCNKALISFMFHAAPRIVHSPAGVHVARVSRVFEVELSTWLDFLVSRTPDKPLRESYARRRYVGKKRLH